MEGDKTCEGVVKMLEYMELSDVERALVENARKFAEREVKPVAEQLDRNREFPLEIIKKAGEQGFLGMLIPQKYGGTELGNFALCLVLEQINKVCAATGITISVQCSLVSSPIIRFGTEEQKQKYLPKIASGEIIGAYCLTEPLAGSDAASLRTRAEKKNGYYILNGEKCFVTNGGYADLFIVYARTEPDIKLKAKGITAFLIEKNFPGVRVGPNEHKMGLRASSTVSLYLEDCKVPQENVLGEINKGFVVAMDTLDGGRIGVATQSLGIAEAAFEKSLEYVKQRGQFGKKLSEYESIQWKLAEMAMNIDAAKLLTYRAAKMRDKKIPHSKEASMAKLFASTMCNKVVREAVQIHGGFGYFEESFVARLFRDQRITELYEGTSEIQRIVIARNLLK